MRWLFHLLTQQSFEQWHSSGAGTYAPASLTREGFIHASYRPAVLESARLYFAPDAQLRVLQVDPRRLAVEVQEAQTPRGAMPHIHGPISRDAIVEVLGLEGMESAPDELGDGREVG